MKALLKNYHQSPRKVRLVADLIRGKSVIAARTALRFLPKKSSPDMAKLLESAVANARTKGANAEDLFIKTITVDKGTAMRRFKPMARGRAAQFSHTLSIIKIELAPSPEKVATPKKAAKPARPDDAGRAGGKTAQNPPAGGRKKAVAKKAE